jgi:hypothetical protein
MDPSTPTRPLVRKDDEHKQKKGIVRRIKQIFNLIVAGAYGSDRDTALLSAKKCVMPSSSKECYYPKEKHLQNVLDGINDKKISPEDLVALFLSLDIPHDSAEHQLHMLNTIMHLCHNCTPFMLTSISETFRILIKNMLENSKTPTDEINGDLVLKYAIYIQNKLYFHFEDSEYNGHFTSFHTSFERSYRVLSSSTAINKVNQNKILDSLSRLVTMQQALIVIANLIVKKTSSTYYSPTKDNSSTSSDKGILYSHKLQHIYRCCLYPLIFIESNTVLIQSVCLLNYLKNNNTSNSNNVALATLTDQTISHFDILKTIFASVEDNKFDEMFLSDKNLPLLPNKLPL